MKETVITYGTFDLFHIGHLKLLQRLRALGDQLIVAVSTDEFNASKGKRAIIPFEQRKEIVSNIKGVDLVIPEHNWEQKYSDIETYGITILGMGDDWLNKFNHLEQYCRIVYLPRTHNVSSSQIRETLSKLNNNANEISNAFEILQSISNTFGH